MLADDDGKPKRKSKKIPMKFKLAAYDREYRLLESEGVRLDPRYSIEEPEHLKKPKRGVKSKENHFFDLLEKITTDYDNYKQLPERP